MVISSHHTDSSPYQVTVQGNGLLWRCTWYPLGRTRAVDEILDICLKQEDPYEDQLLLLATSPRGQLFLFRSPFSFLYTSLHLHELKLHSFVTSARWVSADWSSFAVGVVSSKPPASLRFLSSCAAFSRKKWTSQCCKNYSFVYHSPCISNKSKRMSERRRRRRDSYKGMLPFLWFCISSTSESMISPTGSMNL